MLTLAVSNRRSTLDRTDDGGYSLLEVIIAVAIIAMSVVAAPFAYGEIFPSVKVRQYANELVYEARRLRQEAGRTRSVTSILISNESEKLIEPILETELPDGTKVTLKRDSVFGDSAEERVDFFPSGASSGGEIKISRNGRDIVVLIDWISGHAEIIES